MRMALCLEYDGSRYYGWQRQREVASVQQCVEEALSKIANAPVEVTCAGRTDAGVHATAQIVHFDVPVPRADVAWTLGVNSNLPAGIAVRWAREVDSEFSARFSATSRRYRYIIANTRFRPGIHSAGVSHYHQPLDAEVMQEAAQALVGEHDFTAFRASHCQSHTPFRKVSDLTVERRGDYIIVDISANAFLHHMVRNIVGSLIVVGQHLQPPDWIGELLRQKDRTKAAATAKPGGLYLVAVTYPEHYNIPDAPLGPLWLGD
ncbi:UNVERIFIED_ORG: tRNA pseudouridine38-40 synthase [Idiomarina abyssalis]|uniref:tRNA pseudouridine synthase A n=1 Tax=Idiomarina loihiensis (strain ATCC BAA-735 / DSM 15497 / L2-TR) TaxID=283942 RepID=TRUA_IDILO|nr:MULTISPECIES: tRNA pseudouridine(38-40) synthase TruA [Idiomarina]Q5QUE5.1 RecName: Full=tRNA pseudouridine synthase A; AltName: Full=tRNA pseudouridine(38-40) synthase; AltName: Full=tRNA pseudouridylate synthase I; AltName: Full=tRNA-uridine isomerase I [Idiomarina loihiensis L2TR]HAS22975.1 tRNA pseudouridine(38-40) synthase TruA [Idiomarina loihiensis]AAV81857.1 Pseudouridylate synthase (tRNA psi55) [Idiomarina loihiensis L2TR]AGM35887.1 tRNA pseudouridine synthase A [Idiomarina loihiens